MKKALIYFLVFLLGEGCMHVVDIELESSSGKVVIEGQLSNEPGGNYVRVTLSDPAKTGLIWDKDQAVPLGDALVVISDDQGQVDTLKQEYGSGDERFTGYYLPRTIKGIPGRTYLLTVQVGSQMYRATSYMPLVPPIDSVQVRYVENGKFSGYQPIYYFQDVPSVKNYYLTKVCFDQDYPYYKSYQVGINCGLDGRVWNFSVVDDQYVKPDSVGLNVNLGPTPSTYFIPSLRPGDYQAKLYSLNKEAFAYYEALINSFSNDGGVYSPTPASPPTNIQGGGLGFFNTSAVTIRSFSIPE
ncbi:DUF4249 domain-containing protein [Larkinella sp. GY13]|uniref:DUF4249 domain-containing protein n=1 Tax=Larkinella sp. GY13 TaxID=3453720 RepID=UPI003EEFA9CB